MLSNQSRNRIFIIFTMLLMVGVIFLCFYFPKRGILYLETSGNPAETVSCFYDALIAKEYEKMYLWLKDYSSLGLEPEENKEERTEAEILLHEALLQSYAYEIIGEPEIDQLNATLVVRFQHLDIPGIQKEVQDCFDDRLNRQVQQLPKSEMFTEEGNYRQEALENIYQDLLIDVLQDWSSYLVTEDIRVPVVYMDKQWKIIVTEEMKESILGY